MKALRVSGTQYNTLPRLKLNRKESERFEQAIDHPPKANPRLRKMLRQIFSAKQ